jgi:tetratricopeptide (TPR) repeat protein
MTADAAARAHPKDPDVLISLMITQSTAADLLTDERKYEEAIVLRRNILDLQRRIVELKANDPAARTNLALAHKKLGALYGVQKRYEESRSEYQEALALDEAYVKAVGGPRAQLDLSYDYSDLGWVTIRLGDLPAALAFYRKALALRQSAAAADPNDNRAALSVASSEERIGDLLRLMGDLPAALQQTQHAIVLWKELADRPGSVWTSTRDLADTHAELGDIYITMKNFSRAAAEYDESARLYASLRDRGIPLSAKVDEMKTQAEKCRQSTCIIEP